MAKDNLSLLNEISSQLKKLNQDNVRQRIEDVSYREKESAKQEGRMGDDQPQFIDAGEDLKRRLKANLIGTKVAEKFTDSGKRAKIWLKDQKRPDVVRKDKRVGMFDIIKTGKDTWEAVEKLADSTELKNMPTWFGDTNTTLALIKVNTDKMISQLSGVRHVLGMQQVADTAQFKKINEAAKNKERSELEKNRETNRETVIKSGSGLNIDKAANDATGGGGLIWYIIAGLAGGLIFAIKDIVEGWKAGGLKGIITKFFGGSEEGGLGNAIATSFKVGSTFALAGLMIAGPVGALVGGILGMVVGAFTGWFGKNKIDEWMSGAGKTIGDKMAMIQGKLLKWDRELAEWIYTPGTEARSGNHPAIKAKMFGGTISWDVNQSIGGKIRQALTSFWESLISAPGKIIAWIKEKMPEKLREFIFGDELTPDERDSHHAKMSLIEAKTKTEAIRDQRERAERFFGVDTGTTASMWFGDSTAATRDAAISGMYGATNFGQLDGNLVDKMTNFDEYGNWIGPGSDEWYAKTYKDQREKMGINTLGVQNLISKTKKMELEESKWNSMGGKVRTPNNNEFHTHNKGADAIIVQNIYATDQPIGPALLSIHSHFDNNLAHNLSKGNTAYQQWQ